MIHYLILSVYICLLALALLKSVFQNEEVEFLPSVVWAFCMAIPFVGQMKYFSYFYVPIQSVGVFSFGFLLLIADFWEPFRSQNTLQYAPRPSNLKSQLLWIYAAAIIIGLLQLTHILLMPKIPLLERIKSWELQALDKEHAAADKLYSNLIDQLQKKLVDNTDQQSVLDILQQHRINVQKLDQEEVSIFGNSTESDASRDVHLLIKEYAKNIHDLRQRELGIVDKFSTEISIGIRKNQINENKALIKNYIDIQIGIKDALQKGYANYNSMITTSVSNNLARMRESSSKLLNVPPWFIYLCQAGITLSPVIVGLFFVRRQWLAMLIFLIFSLLYSRLTLAHGPILMLVVMYVVFIWIGISVKWPFLRKWIGITSSVMAFVFLIYALAFLRSNPQSIFQLMNKRSQADKLNGQSSLPLQRGKLTMSIGDYACRMPKKDIKSDDGSNLTSLNKIQYEINYLAYRVFLGPSDVSHRWYTFFPDVYGSHIGLFGLTPGSRKLPDFQHPANMVGRWAYQNRFPEHYGPSIMAYASVDADAWARFGIFGILGISFLVALIRISIKYFRDIGLLQKFLYYASLVVLAMNLSSGSIQAILVAQGLGVILIGLVGCEMMKIFKKTKFRFSVK